MGERGMLGFALMFLVDTYLDKSPIHGIGAYAVGDIPKGAVIWRKVPGIDLEFTPEQIGKLPREAARFLQYYVYFLDGKFHLDGDFARYTNHDDHPNSRMNEKREYIACRKIAKGEEITIDYGEFDQDWPDNAFPDYQDWSI
jgi:SET domain-containing protein